jgi:predicted nucleotidyltransferase
VTSASRALAASRIKRVAAELESVRDELVFIGGSVLPLLVDIERRFDAPRETKDVDAVSAAASYAKSARIEELIRAAGYRHDTSARHRGRWLSPSGEIFDLSFAGDFAGATGIRVDLLAIETAQAMEGHTDIKHLSPTGLFLMKAAAFEDRGRERPADSRDLADLAVLLVGCRLDADVVARRDTVLSEVRARAERLRSVPGLRSALLRHFSDRRPIPPDDPDLLCDEALAMLQRLSPPAT